MISDYSNAVAILVGSRPIPLTHIFVRQLGMEQYNSIQFVCQTTSQYWYDIGVVSWLYHVLRLVDYSHGKDMGISYGSKHSLRKYSTLQMIVNDTSNTSKEGTWIHRDCQLTNYIIYPLVN